MLPGRVDPADRTHIAKRIEQLVLPFLEKRLRATSCAQPRSTSASLTSEQDPLRPVLRSTKDARKCSGSPRVCAMPAEFQPKTPYQRERNERPGASSICSHESLQWSDTATTVPARRLSGLSEAVQTAVVGAEDDAAVRDGGRRGNRSACVELPDIFAPFMRSSS